VTVAHHYEQVHRYRSELGTVDDATSELGEQAMRRLRTAAEQALGREDLAAAGGYAQRALALVSDDEVRQELLLVGCEAFLSSGDVTTGGTLVEQLAAQNRDDRLAAWTDCFQAQLWSLTDADRLDEASARSRTARPPACSPSMTRRASPRRDSCGRSRWHGWVASATAKATSTSR
jgi:hypothetical protein